MLKQEKINEYISLVLLVALGALIAVGLFPFLTSLLGAITLYFLFKPSTIWFEKKWKWSRTLAVTFVLILSFLIILLPCLLIAYSLAEKASEYLQNPQVILEQIKHLISAISRKFKIDLFSEANLETIKNSIGGYVSNFLSQTLSIIASIGIMYFLLYFMLLKSQEMEESVHKLLPYSDKEAKILKNELESHIFSNVLVTPLLALIQGICACILFWSCGLQEPFFWGIICGVFSFIPFVGSSLIWIPAGVFMISQNNTISGVVILTFGFLIIANVDNVFRFVLQKRFANIHPIVTVLGVIIGLQWFGLTGIIFGPVLISFFMILLKSYRNDHIIKSE